MKVVERERNIFFHIIIFKTGVIAFQQFCEVQRLIETLVNEQKTLDELKAEANDEDEAAALEAGFSAWEDAKEELGAVSEIKEDSTF